MKYVKQLVINMVKEFGTSDPYQLARCLGIEVDEFPFRKIKGVIINTMSNVLIVVNSRMSEHEQRAILCHELGHYMLSPPNASYFFITKYTHMNSKYEYLANYFIIELLTYGKEPDIDETLDKFARRIGIPLNIIKYKFRDYTIRP